MKSHLSKTLIILTALAVSLSMGASMASAKGNTPDDLRKAAENIKKDKRRVNFIEAVGEFEKAETLAPFFENSYGVALFPTIGKGGIGIGGAGGGGWVLEKGEVTGEMSMSQVTVGFQWGGQSYSQIIFLEDKNAYDKFTSGNFEFGAQASAVAIKTGAAAQTSTGGGGSASGGKNQSESVYDGGMAIFTVAKGGLMYEASVGGQKFKFKPLKD